MYLYNSKLKNHRHKIKFMLKRVPAKMFGEFYQELGILSGMVTGLLSNFKHPWSTYYSNVLTTTAHKLNQNTCYAFLITQNIH